MPGRQINLMKFVIDHGNISLVIKAEINHKKLLIKTLAISIFPFSSFLWWWGSHSNCFQPFKDSKADFVSQISKGWRSYWRTPRVLMFPALPFEIGGIGRRGMSCAKCLLLRMKRGHMLT